MIICLYNLVCCVCCMMMFLLYYTHFKQDSFILSFWSIEEYSMVVDLKHFREETFPLEKILMSLAVILNYFNCKNPSLTCISLSTDPHFMAFYLRPQFIVKSMLMGPFWFHLYTLWVTHKGPFHSFSRGLPGTPSRTPLREIMQLISGCHSIYLYCFF